MSRRTQIMGVLNVTPDSFSDGGRFVDPGAAIAHGLEMRQQGADIIDIGGESTRPGAPRVAQDEEAARVLPVIRALTGHGIACSIDTMNASTARAAADAGVEYINDVSGGLADADMAQVAASAGVNFIAMHWRGHATAMDALNDYAHLVPDVRAELSARVNALLSAGIAPDKLILDPGLGFSKLGEQNWEMLAGLGEVVSLGHRVLVGASRKRFLAPLLPASASVTHRDLPTHVVSVLAAQNGAWAVRVHDVAGTRVALDVLDAWQSGVRD